MSYQEKLAEIRQQEGTAGIHFGVFEKLKHGFWNHICFSYDTPKRHFALVHNGEVLFNYSRSQSLAFQVPDGPSKSMFTPVSRFPDGSWKSKLWGSSCRSTDNWWEDLTCDNEEDFKNLAFIRILTHHFVGFYTDSNMWSKSLSIDEMIDWTTCKSFAKGNLLPWNPDSWTSIVVDDKGKPMKAQKDVEMDTETLCVKPSPNGKIYTMFGDKMFSHKKAFHLCKQFSGTMAHTSSMDEAQIVSNFMQSMRDSSEDWEAILDEYTWYRYTDEEVEGIWADPETGFVASINNCPDDPNDCQSVIDWDSLYQPEGGRFENCVGVVRSTTAYDGICSTRANVVCENISNEIKVRGLCSVTLIGKKYIMAPEPVNRRRYFSGYTGWSLIFQENIWNLKHTIIEDTFAKYTESEDYPLGRKSWLVTNDACTGEMIFPKLNKAKKWSFVLSK